MSTRPTFSQPQFSLRPARPEDPADLAALYRICLETADSGEDGTPLYADPLLVGHVYAAPYLRFAPDYAFVLEDAQGVCGYVLGVPDTRAFEATLEREWWPELRARYPDPSHIPAPQRSPDERLANLIHHPAVAEASLFPDFPAHLHIDLLPRAQGSGQGRRMMDALLGALRRAGVPGVHLGVGARNGRAQAFYRHLGFQDLSPLAGGAALRFGLRL